MIIDVIFIVLGSVLGAYAWGMSSLTNWAFPTWYETLIESWTESIYQLNMFLPMVKDSGSGTGLYATVGILDMISWFFGVILLIKAVQLVLWLAQFFPWFSPPAQLPGRINDDNTIDLGTSTNRLNLRKFKGRGRIRKNTRDIT